MMESLTGQELFRTLHRMQSNGDIRLPFYAAPNIPEDMIVTEMVWREISFNPPFGEPAAKVRDPAASPKPAFQTVLQAAKAIRLAEWPEFLGVRVNQEATRRIAVLYHPDATYDRNKEWQVRLSGNIPAGADAERVRIAAVCRALEQRIADAATLAELEAIDPADDALWAPPEPGE